MTTLPPDIHPREHWATDSMAPRSELAPEQPRFLLVHHSASSNHYSKSGVVGFIRRVYDQHTRQGWADVAYNFFIDRYGGCWEGRAGSLAGPVVGDATGGNQGYAQSVCVIGNFQAAPPTVESVDALVDLLRWMAERDGIDLGPDARAEFTSRGSNLFPAGHAVRIRTIAGHREVSDTLCPGDHLFALLHRHVPFRVANAIPIRRRER
jgi:hypothetical protein